ncbi:MAG: hypothetical protein M3Z36_09060, partial [Acidobacteriota bacterium]|nr:hypothetical protein [Acidobacteriota bacterium]
VGVGPEVEILTSWDLAQQVAEAIGPQRLLPDSKTPPTSTQAAIVVSRGLSVGTAGGNLLFVSYRNDDPQLAVRVLEELLSRYFVKHLEVHRSAGAFDFVSQQSDQVRARLNQTEDALKPLKEQAGIISLSDSWANLSAELSRTNTELRDTETAVAEQKARIKQMGGSVAAAEQQHSGSDTADPHNVQAAEGQVAQAASPSTIPATAPAAGPTPSPALIQRYGSIVTRLGQLNQTRGEQLTHFTERSNAVQTTQKQIDALELERADLEKRFPELAARAPSAGQPELGPEYVRLAGLTARVDALRTRLEELRMRAKQLADVGPKIAELERKKELEEANYKYFQSTLDKTRIDEALDPSKIPNISAVQKPSPPVIVTASRNKNALRLAGGGFGLGIALALALDFVLNRTVKSRAELERYLHATVLMAIPYIGSNARQLKWKKSQRGSSPDIPRLANGVDNAAVAPWSVGHFIRPYCEAIRDRIGLFFELNNLTHKPKLVGITSFSEAAGTSTLAAGLAAALSETDDGKVLLVDANLGPGDVHPFFEGKPAYSLTAALQPTNGIDAAAENLYLATVGSSSKTGPAQLGLKKFFDLMPNLKASDFDYIIFDMPPLEQTSPTWGMASFMDKMIVVVESDTTNRDVAVRGYNRLMAGRDNVSMVFNKSRSYAPSWLKIED